MTKNLVVLMNGGSAIFLFTTICMMAVKLLVGFWLASFKMTTVRRRFNNNEKHSHQFIVISKMTVLLMLVVRCHHPAMSTIKCSFSLLQKMREVVVLGPLTKKQALNKRFNITFRGG
mmetsp:Transcript_9007/g.14131  ORF Transcript_9007/g.14131 Transcript_9007/m.14131 type:complete len:117 (-) Transcript_9007:117-467(-)